MFRTKNLKPVSDEAVYGGPRNFPLRLRQAELTTVRLCRD